MVLFRTKQKILCTRLVKNTVFLLHSLLGIKNPVHVRRHGVAWHLDLNEAVDFVIYLMGAFEYRTMRAYRRLIRPGDIVLDIGANMGAHTLYMAQAAGSEGTVHAFEPTDIMFDKLERNVAANPELSSRIHCHQLMLLNKETDSCSPVYASWPLDGNSGLHPLHCGRRMTVKNATASTLDAFIEKAQITHIDFIKIDIDGFENFMLSGAQEMFRRWKPTMILELSPHQLDECGSSIEILVNMLSGLGYELTRFSGKALPMDGARLRKITGHGNSINAIARHRAAITAAR